MLSISGSLTSAMQDYVEAIGRLSGERGFARASEIAKELGVSKATVTGALRHLSEMELVNYKPYDVVTLTPQGRDVAERVLRRHRLVSRFLADVLGLPADTAEADACRVEHDLSKETVERLVAFMEFLDTCPRAGADWLQRFAHRCPVGTAHSNGALFGHACRANLPGRTVGGRPHNGTTALSGRRGDGEVACAACIEECLARSGRRR